MTAAKDYSVPISIITAALLISGAWIYSLEPKTPETKENKTEFVFPVNWADLEAKMISVGVIDQEKPFARTPLNLLWALGLANKNPILETGPMAQYGDMGNFASTGGWTLAKEGAMDHYSRHKFFNLTPEQQKLVERVSKNIYRPCCDNPTHFPDCNHGMAMLGLLELMASQGISEQEMYEAALQVNALWFLEEYSTIARYLASKNQTLWAADPKEILGRDYSSASGFRRVASLVPQVKSQGGSGCSI